MSERGKKVVEFNDINLSKASGNCSTYSKFVYDYLLTRLEEYTFNNYSSPGYNSWIFRYPNLELLWDGRDEYLILWDISRTGKKTLKIIETTNLTVEHINQFVDLIHLKKQCLP